MLSVKTTARLLNLPEPSVCYHRYAHTPMSPGSSKVVACRLCHTRLLSANIMQVVGSYCHVVPCHLCYASSMQAGGCQSQCLGGHWASDTSPPVGLPSVGGAHCTAFWRVPIALPCRRLGLRDQWVCLLYPSSLQRHTFHQDSNDLLYLVRLGRSQSGRSTGLCFAKCLEHFVPTM